MSKKREIPILEAHEHKISIIITRLAETSNKKILLLIT